MVAKCYHFFRAIATKLKLDIISILEEKPMCVSDLSANLNQERSKVSHALLSMQHCGFVESSKNGRNVVYSLNNDTIKPMLNLVNNHIKKYCHDCGGA